MNSVFHEPHDKSLLAAQAAHPAQFPRFYTCTGKKNSIKISLVNPPFPLVAEIPLKAVQCRGLWGIMEWLQTLGLEHIEAEFGWEGLAVQGRMCLARVLMLEDAQSGQKCDFGMMHVQGRAAVRQRRTVTVFFTVWCLKDQVEAPGWEEQGAVLALRHPLLPSSLPGFDLFFCLSKSQNLALTSSNRCCFLYNGPNF